MSQNGNTNNNSNRNNSNNFLRDYMTVMSNPDMLSFGLNMFHQPPELAGLRLNILNQYPGATVDFLHTQSNLIQKANQSTNLAHEKEVLTKRNEELQEKNTKLETELSEANKKIAKLDKESNEMKKNMIKTDPINLKIAR